MKTFRKLLIILLIALVVIQFIRPPKNLSATPSPSDIALRYPVPPHIDTLLRGACYDCHSNNTVYPWYWQIQPVTWFMNGHIEDAKRSLNFSTFTSYPAGRQYKVFNNISREVKNGDMPIGSYTLIHRNAILNDSERVAIANWTLACRKQMETTYPADAL